MKTLKQSKLEHAAWWAEHVASLMKDHPDESKYWKELSIWDFEQIGELLRGAIEAYAPLLESSTAALQIMEVHQKLENVDMKWEIDNLRSALSQWHKN